MVPVVTIVAVSCSARTTDLAPLPVIPPLPGEITEYAIPWPDAFPSDIAVDSVGRVWFTDRLTHVIGMLDPETQQFRRFPTLTDTSAPYGMIRAPDGTIWFAESMAGRLGRLDPATGEIEEVKIEGWERGPRLLVWSNDELWFTAREGGLVGRYDPRTGAGRAYVTNERSQPYGIVAAADGSIWISEYGGTTVYRLDPAMDSVEAVPLAEPPPDTLVERLASATSDSARARLSLAFPRRGSVRRLTIDGDGLLWYSDLRRNRVSSFDPRTGRLAHYESLFTPSVPYGIAVDPWGRIWYCECGNDAIVMLDPAARTRVTRTMTTPGGTVRQIAFDLERRRVWLPMSDVGRIGRIDLADPTGGHDPGGRIDPAGPAGR